MIAELERQGISTSRLLPSIHLQAYMRERYGFGEGSAPWSRISRSGRSRSVLHRDRAEDQERVAEAVTAALA